MSRTQSGLWRSFRPLRPARAHLDAQLVPVVRCGGGTPEPVDLTGYSKIFVIPLAAAPENAAGTVPAELPVEPAIALLHDWLQELYGAGAHRAQANELEYAVIEAVLNLLGVLSARGPVAFRLQAPPEPLQPVSPQSSRPATCWRRRPA